jgi:hypothetical protein
MAVDESIWTMNRIFYDIDAFPTHVVSFRKKKTVLNSLKWGWENILARYCTWKNSYNNWWDSDIREDRITPTLGCCFSDKVVAWREPCFLWRRILWWCSSVWRALLHSRPERARLHSSASGRASGIWFPSCIVLPKGSVAHAGFRRYFSATEEPCVLFVWELCTAKVAVSWKSFEIIQ